MLEKIKHVLSFDLQGTDIVQVATIILSIACVVLFLLKANYFNVTVIIKDYLNQFVSTKGSFDKMAFCVALVIPFLLAVVTTLNENESYVNKGSFIDGITLIISILTALFFTIIGLVLDLRLKIKETSKNATEKKRLQELCESVYKIDMFQILVCIILLILCFINMSGIFDLVLLRAAVYYLAYVLLINILMLIKRLYVLINELMQ